MSSMSFLMEDENSFVVGKAGLPELDTAHPHLVHVEICVKVIFFKIPCSCFPVVILCIIELYCSLCPCQKWILHISTSFLSKRYNFLSRFSSGWLVDFQHISVNTLFNAKCRACKINVFKQGSHGIIMMW